MRIIINNNMVLDNNINSEARITTENLLQKLKRWEERVFFHFPSEKICYGSDDLIFDDYIAEIAGFKFIAERDVIYLYTK